MLCVSRGGLNGEDPDRVRPWQTRAHRIFRGWIFPTADGRGEKHPSTAARKVL